MRVYAAVRETPINGHLREPILQTVSYTKIAAGDTAREQHYGRCEVAAFDLREMSNRRRSRPCLKEIPEFNSSRLRRIVRRLVEREDVLQRELALEVSPSDRHRLDAALCEVQSIMIWIVTNIHRTLERNDLA
jgi:hypothetical protein